MDVGVELAMTNLKYEELTAYGGGSSGGRGATHIRLETYKSQDRVAMDAPRRQSVKL